MVTGSGAPPDRFRVSSGARRRHRPRPEDVATPRLGWLASEARLVQASKFAVGISVEPAEGTSGAARTAEERSTDSLKLMVGHNHALLKIDFQARRGLRPCEDLKRVPGRMRHRADRRRSGRIREIVGVACLPAKPQGVGSRPSLSFRLIRDRSAAFMIGCHTSNPRLAVWS